MTATTFESAPPVPLADRLRSLKSLRPFPTAALRLIDACKNPKCSAKDASDIIQKDPGLAARLIRMANSSMFGCSGKIHTIDHAVVLLGMRCVRDLAVAMAGADMFLQGKTATRERHELWNHSLGTACVARRLATSVSNVVPNEAFLAGLFHDVGKLLMYDLVPSHYILLNDIVQKKQKPSHKVEQQLFGSTHAEVGAHFGRECSFPSEVIECIEFHHESKLQGPHADLVSVVSFANAASKVWGIGSQPIDCDDVEYELQNCPVDISRESLELLQESSLADFEESQRICSE